MSWAPSTVGQLLKGLQSPFPWRRRVALWRDVVPAHTPDAEQACGSLSDNKFPVHQQERVLIMNQGLITASLTAGLAWQSVRS